MATAIKIWPEGALTMLTSGAVVGGNCLVVSGNETCAAGGATTNKFLGIAAADAASGAYVTVLGTGPVFDLVSSGTINAGDTVELGASAKVVAHTEGTNDDRVIGIALSAASSNVCRVMLRVG